MISDERVHTGDVDYSGQVFEADADFHGHVFEGDADFSGCVFRGGADFGGAVFQGWTSFNGAVFEAEADFYNGRFARYADFRNVEVAGSLRFSGVSFADGPQLDGAEITGTVRLNRAVFKDASLLGPFRSGRIVLRSAVFERRVRVEADTPQVDATRVRFSGGVQLLVSGADVLLTDCELGPASLVAPNRVAGREGGRPRMVSVSGTDLSNLTFGDVDLSACKFTVAHNLEKVKIEQEDAFGWTPRSVRVSRRRITGDERRWRAANGPHAALWALPADWPARVPPASATEVVKTYRALRKSREDAKDEPGAADFYYGEMDLRRLALRVRARELLRDRQWRGWLAARGEYALLWSYWAVSGYGLRAWRAFAALAVLVALCAAAFLAWGYPPGARMDYADSIRYSLRAATSFLRGPEQKLTATGEWIELVLRFTGPVLFGLAVLALRGRVKR
ncbi:pentapeptide repeat-containing protein [Actinomadura hibisca]|uniref:pentapeptide repeat-containing protein n=1 Tax=Actinomadura hibisca TaxID=68565 RepID=UPI000835F745|nr:pentapeptide repeat-containing protein [Actinomadura hibisca]